MTDRPTETLTEHLRAIRRLAYGVRADRRKPNQVELLAIEIVRQVDRALALLLAHSGEEPQTDDHDVENVNQCSANGCEPDGERGNTNRSVPTSREHNREMGQPSDEVTASPAKTGDDLERDGTFAMIAEALGEPSAAASRWRLSLAEKQLLLLGLWVIWEQGRVDPALLTDYWALREALDSTPAASGVPYVAGPLTPNTFSPAEIDALRQVLPAPSAAAAEPLYPCDDCGAHRTKAQGGTIFTVCDECWDKHYKQVTASPAAPVEPLREALRKLANEASGFLSMADEGTHGHTNMAVLRQRISEAYAALNPVAVGVLRNAADELSSDPRHIERPSGK